MRRAIEPAGIALVLTAAGFLIDQWPTELSVGHFILTLCAVFFIHTLIRDLVLYANHRLGSNSPSRAREGQCFCLESALGMIFLGIGLILFATNASGLVKLNQYAWLVVLGGLMLANYGLRDYVFGWNPWRIYRDPNHQNIIPRW